MLPALYCILSIERIRDGGSLAVSFAVKDTTCYWLWFDKQLLEQHLIIGLPTLIDRLTQTRVDISWSHARSLLNQIAHFNTVVDQDALTVLAAMIALTERAMRSIE